MELQGSQPAAGHGPLQRLPQKILRISEVRDQGDVNRYQFYEHTKNYLAEPPDELRVDEKNLREYDILNRCGVVMTTNHRTNGIYLPPNDRCHYVTWSDLPPEHFTADYFLSMFRWLESEGFAHVAAYLATLDISSFNPKAPPPKTPAFWAIVDANRAPEDAEMADALDRLGNPDATTLTRILDAASDELGMWLRDSHNRRAIPHRLEDCEYVAVRNEDANDGHWKVGDRRQVIYAKKSISKQEQIAAAKRLARGREVLP